MFIGIDIGGTKLLVAAKQESSQPSNMQRMPMPLKLEHGLSLIKELCHKLAAKSQIRAIGVSCGGPLDIMSGLVSPLHCPEWRNIQLKNILETEFGCPVRIEVDTDAAALAEFSALKQKPSRLLYVTLSTGLGGSLLIDGEIYRGHNFSHPEVGHQVVPSRFQDLACKCGALGCLEAAICGSAIPKNFKKPAEQLNQNEWREIGQILGLGLRNMIMMYAPDLVILGGGMAVGGGEVLRAETQAVVDRSCKIVPSCQINISALADQSAILGALELATKVN